MRRTGNPFGYNEIFAMYFISAQHRNPLLKRGLPPNLKPNPPDENRGPSPEAIVY